MGELRNIRSRTVAGAAAGDMTVTGILKGDFLLTVVTVSAAGANLASEFTVTADNTINNLGGTSTAGAVVLVEWERRDGGRDGIRIPVTQPIGRSPS